mmetsp:Transcript_50450/g.161456  ORF Transcript_50450/g.161456 Transcript_50450/m.161456 type:complete len:260 (-) Transcript_50450:100-879(-)
MRPGAQRQRVQRGVDAARDIPGRGHKLWGGANMGRRAVQEDPGHGGASHARGDPGLELAHALQREPGQEHPAAGCAGAGGLRQQAGGPQVGGLRAQVVVRRQGACVGGQRQPAVHLEHALHLARATVQRALGGGQGHLVVPAPARAARVGGGHGGPLRALLEHVDQQRAAVRGHGEPGLQPRVVQERQRAGEHARVQPEPDHRVALPHHDQARHAHGAHAAGALPGHLPRRPDHRDRGRGRDAALLERVPGAQEPGLRA